jgi:hypothetical protein
MGARLGERRTILPLQLAIDEGRRLRERRNRHVPVQLHVLALAPQQPEHPIDELVLAHTLAANE